MKGGAIYIILNLSLKGMQALELDTMVNSLRDHVKDENWKSQSLFPM